jgi:alkanesulfonate monooxygenase SsuD/methylene tetrahydromethanopterin reductase-like flavin-dependent oxidoreductase (luciferase family)
VRVSVSIEGLCGLTWPLWRRLVAEVEGLGFAALYMSDHFPGSGGDTGQLPSLDVVPALTYAADHTDHVTLGPLVSPLSFRDPVMLARHALALNDLSGGRMVLGVGAGWNEKEHLMFGYTLGDMDTRFARFEEGLEVMTRLLESTGPVSFSGQFFELHDAVLPSDGARTQPVPILVGGSGVRRTLPLVARYATIWNATNLSAEGFRERSATLSELARSAGREPDSIARTMLIPVFCGETPAELERRFACVRRGLPDFGSLSFDDLRSVMVEPSGFGAYVGPREGLVAHLAAYAEAGVSEVIIQWAGVDDIDALIALASFVLPALAEAG